MMRISFWVVVVASLLGPAFAAPPAAPAAYGFMRYASMHRHTGYDSHSPLVQGADGALYGTTEFGHPHYGTIFRVDAFHHLSVLHAFSDDGAEGANPGPLLRGSDGWFYGSTVMSDVAGGSIYRVSPGGDFQLLYTFPPAGVYDFPSGAMVRDEAGNLYTTVYNSPRPGGAIVRVAPDGTMKVLRDFDKEAARNAYLRGGLTGGADGRLYGVTSGDTLAFSVARDGRDFRVLHEFAEADGCQPDSPPVFGADGALYGTMTYCGAGKGGTAYRLALDGSFRVLHAFAHGDPLGDTPLRGLSVGPDGTLYGTTVYTDGQDGGTVYALTPDGVATRLHLFDAAHARMRGLDPVAPPTVLPDGELWGTTASGGVGDVGIVYTLHAGK